MVLVKMRNGAVLVRVSISTVSNLLSESAASCEIPFLTTASMYHLLGTVPLCEKRRTIAEISRYQDEHIEDLLVCTSTPHQAEMFLCRPAASSSPVIAIWSRMHLRPLAMWNQLPFVRLMLPDSHTHR